MTREWWVGVAHPLSCQCVSECNATKQAPAGAFPSGATRQNPSQRSDGGTERGLVTQRTGFVPVLPLVMTRPHPSLWFLCHLAYDSLT